MKRLASLACLPVIIALAVTACTSANCVEDTDPLVATNIYSSVKKKTVTCDSIIVTAKSTAGDTIITKEKAVSLFTFTLDPANTQSTLLFKLDNVTDTVVITYTSSPYYISSACGYTICHRITALTSTDNIIDSLVLENKSVTLDGKSNLRLYY
ncbi:MAG TPA: DUF6452 family protein [Bacteroidales bacterium]|nr:DUF6452 family protein [Bacteroidales bacterium]